MNRNQILPPSFADNRRLRVRHSLLMLLTVLTCFSSSQLASDTAAAGEKQPNIVIVLVDDMGYGDPQCFNPDSKIATPNIDAIAASGMSFTDAHAAGPLCHLSRYGLITGRYPFRANPGKWATQPTIDDDQMTIANFLQIAGYQTAMVGKWHLGFHENGYDKPLTGGPIHRGFETFFGIRASTDIPPYFYIRGDRAVSPPSNHIEARNTEGWSKIQGEFWRAGGIAPDLQLKDVLPRFTEEALTVIRTSAAVPEAERRPLMLYLAYPAPHTPWLPSAEFVGKSGAGMYGDFVMMVDDQVGRITRELEAAGIADETLLIFTSDNGPTWYDVDHEKFGHDSSGGFRGMKSDAWEAGHRVPFIVRWPGLVKPGTKSSSTINFVDIMATFADVLERELPDGAGPDSYSFHPVLVSEVASDYRIRGDLIIQSGGGLMTLRHGDWKLIDGLGSGGFSEPRKLKPEPEGPTGQLYNLASDPAEEHNVYLDHPDVVARLKHRMQQIRTADSHRLMP